MKGSMRKTIAEFQKLWYTKSRNRLRQAASLAFSDENNRLSALSLYLYGYPYEHQEKERAFTRIKAMIIIIMDLPIRYRQKLETIIAESGIKTSVLSEAVQRMSHVYREASGQGERLVTKQADVLAYAAVRMPATFGAVSSSLTAALAALPADTAGTIRSVLDLGAGTGAASLAVSEVLSAYQSQLPVSFTAVEREDEMLMLGRTLTEEIPGICWTQNDVLSSLRMYAEQGTTFDLVVASYMTNELSREVRQALPALLWRVTGRLLLITEPGTMTGFHIIRDARKDFSALGANICAPCPAVSECPVPENDWCHFTCRVARSRLHKQLKGGDVPYEDEKFSYLALSRIPASPCSARILRHPQKSAGRISLVLCMTDGIRQSVVTKKDKDLFSVARKSGAGDAF